MCLKKIIILLLLLFENSAHALEFKFIAGIRSQSANVGPGTDRVQKESFQIGFLVPLHTANRFSISTGLKYTQRNLDYKVIDSSLFAPLFYISSGSFDFSYLDIPLQLEYSFNQNILIWGGPIAGFNVSSKCKTNSPNVDCDLKSTKNVILPVSVGIDFVLVDAMGVSVFYESTSNNSSGELAQNIHSYTAVGINIFSKY